VVKEGGFINDKEKIVNLIDNHQKLIFSICYKITADYFAAEDLTQETFSDAPVKDQEFLRLFSFISMLSFDVYIKRLMIEKMIDSMSVKPNDKAKETKK
jgi:DNA-directed RNA polymerase specialized sigma24 family protein